MKIFLRNILKDIELKSEGSFISAELLIKAQLLGFRIRQIPVRYFPRKYGLSKLSSPRIILKIIFEMIKLFPELKMISLRQKIYRDLKILYKHAGLKTKVYNL